MLSSRQEAAAIGRMGEEKVAEYLRRHGYIILKRNWRNSRFGEIDIIAENRENIVFVEVKTRTNISVASGIDAVDARKMPRIRSAAEVFMQRLNTDLPPRIDVAEVLVITDKSGEKKWKLKYQKSVF